MNEDKNDTAILKLVNRLAENPEPRTFSSLIELVSESLLSDPQTEGSFQSIISILKHERLWDLDRYSEFLILLSSSKFAFATLQIDEICDVLSTIYPRVESDISRLSICNFVIDVLKPGEAVEVLEELLNRAVTLQLPQSELVWALISIASNSDVPRQAAERARSATSKALRSQ